MNDSQESIRHRSKNYLQLARCLVLSRHVKRKLIVPERDIKDSRNFWGFTLYCWIQNHSFKLGLPLNSLQKNYKYRCKSCIQHSPSSHYWRKPYIRANLYGTSASFRNYWRSSIGALFINISGKLGLRIASATKILRAAPNAKMNKNTL